MDAAVKYATIIVRDMDESVRFYTDVLGFELDSQFTPRPDTTITLMKGRGEALVELIQSPAHEVGFYSVGLDVKDLNATVEELKAKGTPIVSGPTPTLDGGLAFIEDPNGVRIAVIQHG